MKQYHVANNIIGWVIGLIACAVYIMTAEATASWWDCGEYISTAFKLQVGHPPGAPTFQLVGRLFSMFSSPETAAHAVNVMSAVCSGLTILFLFWAITLLGKHLLPDQKNPSLKDWRTWGVFAAGVVGSLAYCFSDTFWFSAVEGEVYAMSSFFTALVFWAILKWEEQSDDPHALRWLILISLLVGVAIGVHLLNLLTVPAIFYVVYFKKWPKTTWKGFIVTGVLSIITLGVILWGIIPGIVNIDSAVDVFFVNTLGLPFGSGTVVYFTLIAALVVWGLWYTQKKSKPIFNAAILSFAMLVIGYSTFFVLVIRANTNTPLNENAPKDAVSMRAYLGREQYGDTPLFKGQFYTAGGPTGIEKGYTKYVRGKNAEGKDRYIVAAYAQKYVYNERHTGVFPRMWSDDKRRDHPRFYEYWAGKCYNGQKPTGAQNLQFFNRYQLGWMYWRYFMWNFAGRQNDIQGHYFNEDGTRDYLNGNWISGIKFIDESRLGPQDNMPEHMENNKARNKYYMLPLLLGIIGLIYHIRKHPKDAFIVFIMFFMTGLAIAIYLNMPPKQPRERDYAFVGSFSFYAIWIGLGVMALSEWISGLFKKRGATADDKAAAPKAYKVVMPVVFVVCMLAVPCLMAAENWDDHDRSQKTAARDFAQNYLKSIKKNGILITFGDNDTFPLWYAQEVEGTRTDVRILNYTLSGMYWYVEQLFNKLYEGDALPFTLPKEFYGLGKDQYFIMDRSNEYLEVTDVLAMLRDHPDRFTIRDQRTGDEFMYLPTKRFKITLDVPALVEAGVIPAELAEYVNPEIRWEIGKQILYRHELMMLDILGTNRFMRDISIMNAGYIRDVFTPVYGYTVQDGMNHKLIPYPSKLIPYTRQGEPYSPSTADYFINGVDGEPLQWGNLNKDIYVDPISLNSGGVQRQTFAMIAYDEYCKGNVEKARKLLDLAQEFFPAPNFPINVYSIYIMTSAVRVDIVELYKNVYGMDKARELWNDAFKYYDAELNYLARFRGDKVAGVRGQIQDDLQVMKILNDIARYTLEDASLVNQTNDILTRFLNK